MTDLTLMKKMIVAFGILGAVSASSIGLGLIGMAGQQSAMAQIEEATVLLRAQGDADMHHDTIRSAVTAIVAAESNPAFDGMAAANELNEVVDQFANEMQVTAAFTGDDAITAAREAAQGPMESYISTSRRIAADRLAGTAPDARSLQRFDEDFRLLETDMESLSDAVQQHVSTTQQDAARTSAIAEYVLLACLVAIIVALFAVARLCRRHVLQPLYQLQTTLAEIGAGHYDTDVQGCDRTDEIGDLSRSVAQLGQNLVRVRSEKNGISASVVSTIGEGLSRMAGGQLDRHVAGPLDGPFERLRTDFNAAVDALAGTLGMVHSSTTELRMTMLEIERATGDVAARNTQQAANLEETVAAITDLTRRALDSVEAVDRARASIETVSREVLEGGRVINDAEQAMDRIENASTEISKIIAVIDGIAFQTNLLALNAGVEAARAGESGKGFAVVATEVRALAQRSAEAANEIKQLIGNSSAEVVDGVRLVRAAGTALRRISDQMDEINQVMDKVQAATTEQGDTLRHISASAQQMDQMTQSNAAATEEVLASTRGVTQAVTQVASQISTFSLPGVDRRQHPRLAA